MNESQYNQQSLFPSEIQESEVLYVIGNGFDIAHGVESKYSEFERWCRTSKKNTGIFDSLFSTKSDFWSNIEVALGDYDEKAILDFCKPDEEFDLDHSLSSSARIEDAPECILKPALDELKEYFIEWVNSINLKDIEDYLILHKNAKYISFNYTETLEKIYSISKENICHIHGCRLLKNDDYVFGHNNHRDTNSYGDDLPLFEENAYLSILNYLNDFEKQINEIIAANTAFFEQLRDTKLVYVLGHSISEIDMPYFDYLLSIFSKQPRFVFSSNSTEDSRRIESFIREKRISQHRIIKLDQFGKIS